MATNSRAWVLVGVALLAVGLVIVLLNSGEREQPADLAADPHLGGGDLTVYLYEDYQCSHCRDYSLGPGFKQLYDNWVATDKIQLVWRHVAFVGPHSMSAARASACAFDANPQSWLDFDHTIYQIQADGGQPTPTALRAAALALEVNADSYDSCMEDVPRGTARVDNNLADLKVSGASSTPSVQVGSQVFNGHEHDAIDAAIQEALGEA